jgi:hypothetical protein
VQCTDSQLHTKNLQQHSKYTERNHTNGRRNDDIWQWKATDLVWISRCSGERASCTNA